MVPGDRTFFKGLGLVSIKKRPVKITMAAKSINVLCIITLLMEKKKKTPTTQTFPSTMIGNIHWFSPVCAPVWSVELSDQCKECLEYCLHNPLCIPCVSHTHTGIVGPLTLASAAEGSGLSLGLSMHSGLGGLGRDIFPTCFLPHWHIRLFWWFDRISDGVVIASTCL